MSTVEYTAPDGQTFDVSGPPEGVEIEPELSWSDRMSQQVRAAEATGFAKAAMQAAEEVEEDEVDPDEMNVVPNRKAQRDAANLRGSIRLNRSRVRRRIHRVLVKRGFWQ